MKLTSFYIKQKGWRSLQHPHQEPKMFLCSSFFFGLTFSIILEVKMSEWSITAGHEILCAIWFHLHNLKNVKNIHRGMISVTPPWLFFTFLVPNRIWHMTWIEFTQHVCITSWTYVLHMRIQSRSRVHQARNRSCREGYLYTCNCLILFHLDRIQAKHLDLKKKMGILRGQCERSSVRLRDIPLKCKSRL